MKTNRPSKWKVLLVAVVFSGTLVLGQARQADACFEPITCTVAIVWTYMAVTATVCTPVAAVKALNGPTSFSGAFKDCWYWLRPSQQAAPSQTSETEPTPQLEGTESAGAQE